MRGTIYKRPDGSFFRMHGNGTAAFLVPPKRPFSATGMPGLISVIERDQDGNHGALFIRDKLEAVMDWLEAGDAGRIKQ